MITTPRLILRQIAKKDAQAIFSYAKLPNVGPSAGWNPLRTLEEAHEFIRYSIEKQRSGQPGVWSIILKDERLVIGTIEIHSFYKYKGEIGFALHPAYWSKGIISEASKAVMIYAFEELKLKRLSLAHFLDNHASNRVAKKLGFKEEGIQRKGFLHGDGRVLDEQILSFTDDDYRIQYVEVFEPFKEKITIK